jgi:hypothetical protein
MSISFPLGGSLYYARDLGKVAGGPGIPLEDERFCVGPDASSKIAYVVWQEITARLLQKVALIEATENWETLTGGGVPCPVAGLGAHPVLRGGHGMQQADEGGWVGGLHVGGGTG